MHAGKYKIITTSDDTEGLLHKVATPIDDADTETRNILGMLYDRVPLSKIACGLALPQVGISKRGLVINGKYYGKKYGGVFINPVITRQSDTTNVLNEQCLSEPGVNVPVDRYNAIKVRYEDAFGTIKNKYFEGRVARVLQHEIDHLDGILLTDKQKQDGINEKSEKSIAI